MRFTSRENVVGFIELIGIAIGLSMDAFAVSVCKGLTLKKMDYGKALKAGLYFGVFQAVMPLIGFIAGAAFAEYVDEYDHWIAFVLLLLIGGKMILESIKSNGEELPDPSFSAGTMLILAVATSIDALMIGVSFAFMGVASIGFDVGIIGIVTFIFSFAGVKIGNVFGMRFRKGGWC